MRALYPTSFRKQRRFILSIRTEQIYKTKTAQRLARLAAVAVSLAACNAGSDKQEVNGGPDASYGPDAGGLAPSPDAGATSGVAPPEGFCRYGWCWLYPLPQGNNLTAVGASSPNDVWAAGNFGMAMHYDGVTWTRVDMDANSDPVTQLWGTQPDDFWALSRTNVLHWNGTQWSTVNEMSGTVIGGTGPSNVWLAAGDEMYHFDGDDWTLEPIVPQPPAPIGDIIAISPGPNTTVLSTTGAIATWQSGAWTLTDPGTHPVGAAAWVSDSEFIAVVEPTEEDIPSPVATWHWTSGVWDSMPTVSLPPEGPVKVAAASASDVWIVNSDQSAWHWDGCPSWTRH